MAVATMLCFVCLLATLSGAQILGVHLSMTYGYSASDSISISSTVKNATQQIFEQLIEDLQICVTSDEYHLTIAQYGNIHLQTLNAVITCCNSSSQSTLSSSLESDFLYDFNQLINASFSTVIDTDSSRTHISAIVSSSDPPSVQSTPFADTTESTDAASTTDASETEVGRFDAQQENAANDFNAEENGLWRWFLFLFLLIVICVGLLIHHKNYVGSATENALFSHQLTVAGNMNTHQKRGRALSLPPTMKTSDDKDEYDEYEVADMKIVFDDAYAKTGRTSDILSVTPGRLIASMGASHTSSLQGITEETKEKKGITEEKKVVEMEGLEPTGIARQTSSGANDEYEFMQWLKRLDLDDYVEVLMEHGFSSAADLAARINDESELINLGIKWDDEDDRKTLWCEIVELQSAEQIEK